jgi:hypothetical protein
MFVRICVIRYALNLFLLSREIPKFIVGLPEEALDTPMDQAKNPQAEIFAEHKSGVDIM